MAKYILGDIFQGNYSVSQAYGDNPDYYKQFGFAGHEGVDWATPTGTPILAPFDGKIIQDQDDKKSGAYGNYLVCFDPIQRCAVWYCHLDSNIVDINEPVKKGRILGYTGNSGNSTGPHIHVNFVETDEYANRLNRDNGYKGFLNILDPELVDWQLEEGSIIIPEEPDMITDQTKIPQIENMEVQAIRSQLFDLRKAVKNLEEDLLRLRSDIDDYKHANDLQAETLTNRDKTINELTIELQKCRENSETPSHGTDLSFFQLFTMLLKKIIPQ